MESVIMIIRIRILALVEALRTTGCICVVLLVTASFTGQQVMATDAPATSNTILNCTLGGPTTYSGDHIDQACAWTEAFSFGEVSTAASTEVTVGDGVQARTTAFSQTDIENINPLITYASSDLRLFYSFTTEQVAAPPVQLAHIPLMFTGSTSTSVEGIGSYSGFVGVENSYGVFYGIEYSDAEGDVEFSFVDNYLVGSIYRVSVQSFCSSMVEGATSSSCTSDIFTSVDFDQSEFDLMMGDNTFLLSDYFEITYSSNLTRVPVPATIWLFLSACAFLTARREKAA